MIEKYVILYDFDLYLHMLYSKIDKQSMQTLQPIKRAETCVKSFSNIDSLFTQ